MHKQPADGVKPLEAYAGALVASGRHDAASANKQVFLPTGYPTTVEVVPGVVYAAPASYDYAPDVSVAHVKISALKHAARSGRLAVINMTMEPGSGKTIHLPFKFVDSRSLVVLPTLFDAWTAHATAAEPSGIVTYAYSSKSKHRVNYTDSYHAAYLLSTDGLKEYDIVFVDESHSTDGVTAFLASACRKGTTFVRMTATPPTCETKPRKAFSVMEEGVAPDYSDLSGLSGFLQSRPEPRKLAMMPTAEDAVAASRATPKSVTLTSSTPLAAVSSVLCDQGGPCTIFADSVCSRSINLALDFVLDYGLVQTPVGVRPISVAEKQQRKYRVGRNKVGVYCYVGPEPQPTPRDSFSEYRNGLWFTLNGLVDSPTHVAGLEPADLNRLLSSPCEPALLERTRRPESTSRGEVDRTRAGESQRRDSAVDAHRDVELLSICEHLEGERPGSPGPPWYLYFTLPKNHPFMYVGDMIHDVRGVSDSYLRLGDVGIERSEARVAAVAAAGGASSRDVSVRSLASESTLSPSWTRPREWKRRRSSSRAVATSRSGLETANSRVVWYSGSSDEDTPLKLVRCTVYKGRETMHVYKAYAMVQGFLVEAGVGLATSPGFVHGLKPMSRTQRRVLNSGDSSHSCTTPASHYLTWSVVHTIQPGGRGLDAYAGPAGSSTIPLLNRVPTVDLSAEYHPSWPEVVGNLVSSRATLPLLVPTFGWSRKSCRYEDDVDLVGEALQLAVEHSYAKEDQRLMFRAWNILASVTASVAGCDPKVYAQAGTLLTCMSSADRVRQVRTV